MALSDWNRTYNTGNDFLDDSFSYEGSSCLRMVNVDQYKAYMWPPSQESNDSPSEGRLTTRTYVGGSQSAYVGFHFRGTDDFVNGSDDDEAYFARFDYKDNRLKFVVSHQNNGSVWPNGQERTVAADGSRFDDQWTPYRVDFWMDENGDLRIQGFHDADLDGSWTLVNDTDIVDTNPQNNNGGAMGFGSTFQYYNDNDIRYEESKVYY